MIVFLYIAAAVTAYLVCGLNPAIVLSNAVYHKDIRTCGSGNAGFTNFKRTFGNKLAWWVLLLDLAKSAAVMTLFSILFMIFQGDFQLGAAYTSLFVMLGHSYPIWYKFRGGKGFLVYMSAIWFIDWRCGVIALAIMMILLFTTKYMSLSTVCAMLSCPITLLIVGTPIAVICMCAACVLFIAWRHRENFKRLIHGTESKFSLKSKKAS